MKTYETTITTLSAKDKDKLLNVLEKAGFEAAIFLNGDCRTEEESGSARYRAERRNIEAFNRDELDLY